MSRTVIALYDDFTTAQRVVEELVNAGFSRDSISMVAPDASGEYGRFVKTSGDGTEDDVDSGEGAGFGAVVGALVGLGVALIPGIGPVVAAGPLAAALMAGIGAATGAVTGGLVAGLVDMGIPEEEAHWYAEGMRRGATMVSVTTDDASVNRAQDIMNRFNPIDLDERAASWQQSGWKGYEANAKPYTADQMAAERKQYMTSTPASTTTTNTSTRTPATATGQQKFEVVEEDLKVGKRQVESGGVRIRSYVTAKPVEEQIRLREEHVHVERRPVDRPATQADFSAFKEGVMEVTEHHEEAVVSKDARVVEEVVVGKDVTEHTETVRDTVRRTDVEVERTGATGTASGTTYKPYETYETTFRNRFNTRYGSTSGATFDQYAPAYRYGYSLATNNQYRDYDWARLEPEARRYWEERNPSTWERFKDAIHDAWMDVTGRR